LISLLQARCRSIQFEVSEKPHVLKWLGIQNLASFQKIALSVVGQITLLDFTLKVNMFMAILAQRAASYSDSTSI
jgi:hypothetical protein